MVRFINYFSEKLYDKFHVESLSPRSPNSMLCLCHGELPKVVLALFITLNFGRGSCEVYFVNEH
jgi:hypothetical protein